MFNCIIQCYWINRYIAWFSTVWWGNIFQKEEIYSKKGKYIPKRWIFSKKRKNIPKRGNTFQKDEIYSKKRKYIPKKWKFIFQKDEIYSKQNKYKPKRGMLLRSFWTAGIAMHCWCLVKMYFFLQLLTNNFSQTWQIRLHFSYLCVMGGGKNLGTKPAPSQGL